MCHRSRMASGYRFFTAAEQAFIEAAIDRLIPPDELGPSATQANVHAFLDASLPVPSAAATTIYLGGPWPKGTPEQGYQSRFTPAQLYRAAIAAIERYVGDELQRRDVQGARAGRQERVLKALESGELQLDGGVDGKAFFAMLLQNTKEGYFSDPIYGGNKDMAAWKMIGFPGRALRLHANGSSRHGERVPYPPVGIKGRPGWSEG